MQDKIVKIIKWRLKNKSPSAKTFGSNPSYHVLNKKGIIAVLHNRFVTFQGIIAQILGALAFTSNFSCLSSPFQINNHIYICRI